MYSAYKLNKQGDNIQPWRTPLQLYVLYTYTSGQEYKNPWNLQTKDKARIQGGGGGSEDSETLGWKKHKLDSRLPGEISITSEMQMTLPLWQKVKRN